jgi:hypothetical protein
MKRSFCATSAEFVSNLRNPGRKADLAAGMVRPGSLLATAGTENTGEVRDAVGRVCAVRDCVIKEEAAIRAGTSGCTQIADSMTAQDSLLLKTSLSTVFSVVQHFR